LPGFKPEFNPGVEIRRRMKEADLGGGMHDPTGIEGMLAEDVGGN